MAIYKVTAPDTEASNTVLVNTRTMTPEMIERMVQGVLEVDPSEFEVSETLDKITVFSQYPDPSTAAALGLDIEEVVQRGRAGGAMRFKESAKALFLLLMFLALGAIPVIALIQGDIWLLVTAWIITWGALMILWLAWATKD